ncbi:K+-transporting ATPase ATPase A chain [Paenibacillus sp. SORGH_AS306]|uniref:Potassium-transporting ATPase potassium-binding subunit n=1 Tax=Paenibacillus kyungheensis TaxID=1452732 RepID=A0AAX3M7T9_9BACL|nr:MULTISPECIES: potassium-transporting ATPase subunit KdpA [Paenibacillus]MDQ1233973.1 K+-transporting ATPase ATPase A chain [Paenibacillus sp. SORGH_AS_0306]MDR6111018.1 K+-transporting ATPase ATPase A chain [Paenibacillus sp. SORGH_AS_0338]WCT57873.1 potassium-transporting ATPase subunit KdpA [Paenibacillus kyungheensis]WDF49023.1 potassium-transporting ATPase subunit KdpA [Paenibacillus sp. KACC 21273]
MSIFSYIGIAVTIIIAILIARPTGHYIAYAFENKPNRLDRWFYPIEKWIYRFGGIKNENQTWKQYAGAVLISNSVILLITYMIFRFQHILPMNPAGITNMSPDLAFNTAISFITNTNLQHYSGESGLSLFSQMTAIIFMMFVSPATGIAVAIAFIRGITGKPLGNFFTDLVRAITRILLPLAFVMAIVFVGLGVPQTLHTLITAQTLQGTEQQIGTGPIGSFLAIKELGNNGGGYFGANSAHPFENPGGFSNMLQMLMMLLVPMSLPFTYGKMVGNSKQGRVLFVSMVMMFVVMLSVSLVSESQGNPLINQLGIQHQSGSMEGKEVRLGEAQSSFYSVVTTASETGAVNNMHDTLTPIGGLISLGNMMLNTVFGGSGVGLLNILMYAIIAVFLSGLMVGRTPEFLGRKIEGKEMKLIAVTLLIQPLLVLAPTAIAVMTQSDTISNPGYHGLTQALYEFTSSAANNGSGFEGLGDNTPFWNIMTGVVMFISRYFSMVTLLAVAGSLMAKKPVPETSGTLRTDQALFGGMFIISVILVGALTFFPAVVLGPIAEMLTL